MHDLHNLANKKLQEHMFARKASLSEEYSALIVRFIY